MTQERDQIPPDMRNMRFDVRGDQPLDWDDEGNVTDWAPALYDATDYVAKLEATIEQLRGELRREKDMRIAAQQDLQDFKNRRGWTEVSIERDRNTGMTVVLRTEYRLRAESMRLEVADIYSNMGRWSPEALDLEPTRSGLT